MNILIADDNAIMRNLIKFYLTKYNFNISEVTDGVAVLKKFKEKYYDILFLDICMPNLDGMNVVKYLKNKNIETKIILISSNIDTDTISELQKYGIRYFLTKPINITMFHQTVKEILEMNLNQKNKCMQLSIDSAWKYQLLTYPNPAVGATVVQMGKVLAVESHKKSGEAHAEVLALKMAYLSKYPDSDLKNIENSSEIHKYLTENHNDFFINCKIYVTLEPCNHIGKTPACAMLLESIKINKVYIGTLDPNKDASGGKERLEKAGISVEVNICKKETDKLLYPFLKYQSGNFTFFKIAMREDGSIDEGYITTQESLNLVHEMRTKIDLMVVGGNTVRTDKPTLDARFSQSKKAPDILIYSRSKEFDETIPLFKIKNREVTIGSDLNLMNTKKFVMIEGGYNFFNLLKRKIDYLVIFISHKDKKEKRKSIEDKNFKKEYSYFLNNDDEIIFLKKVNEKGLS